MTLRRFLTSAVALGAIGTLSLFAAQPAWAGITLTATSTAGAIPLSPLTAMVGTDPASLSPHTITLDTTAGTFVVGGNTLAFTTVSMAQTNTPTLAPTGSITKALADTTTVTIENRSGPAITITLTVVFDTFNFPSSNPLIWTSTIATTRLDGGATFGSTETIAPAGLTITHATLTAPGSQVLVNTVSPGRPFSVTQVLTIFLPTGAFANVQKSDTLSSVPEPGTIAMAFSGLPILGLLWARRRRA